MIIGFVFAVLCAGALVAILGWAGQRGKSFASVIMGGYALRLLLQFFIRDIPFFSHGLGGDSAAYEDYGRMIADSWRHVGFAFITADELPLLGPTSLPSNLFALPIYLNGGEATRLGCTALVAFVAGLTAINIYTLAVQVGAREKSALLFSCIIYFQPAFLFYTADTYKDGFVVCLALGALGSALRLSSKFSLVHALIGLGCVWALWYVRFYLLFVAVAPLLVGTAGLRTKRIARPVLAALILATIAIALASFTDILQLAADRASETFALGTSVDVRADNAQGGSGVLFDDGGVAYRALPSKLAYTLFSPFLWQGGSLGFQFGKLDVLMWYFMIYRAIRGARQADMRVVLMMLTFIVPCTVMYAMSMANVGLIVRQRLVIVAATAILAAVYTPRPKAATVRARLPLRARRVPARRAAA